MDRSAQQNPEGDLAVYLRYRNGGDNNYKKYRTHAAGDR